MALVIEDGTGKPNANSFVTTAEFTAWAEARGLSVSDDSDKLEQYAVLSTDYFKIREDDFSGDRIFGIQALPFPRTNQYIYGVLVPDGVIPPQVKDAQYAIMYTIASGINLFPQSAERVLKRTKTGPLEKEWFDNNTAPSVPMIDAALAPLLGPGGWGLTVVRI